MEFACLAHGGPASELCPTARLRLPPALREILDRSDDALRNAVDAVEQGPVFGLAPCDRVDYRLIPVEHDDNGNQYEGEECQ